MGLAADAIGIVAADVERDIVAAEVGEFLRRTARPTTSLPERPPCAT